MKIDAKSYTGKELNIPKCKCNSDTFVCNLHSEHRLILKVYGNSTPCRIEGCKGTMYRQ